MPVRVLGWPAAVRAVSSGDRGAAADGFRTYMMMLLTGAPVLLDDPVARRFLEQAQDLGAVMASALAQAGPPDGAAAPADRLDDAVRQLRTAAAPLVQLLSPATRDAIHRLGQTAEE